MDYKDRYGAKFMGASKKNNNKVGILFEFVGFERFLQSKNCKRFNILWFMV